MIFRRMAELTRGGLDSDERGELPTDRVIGGILLEPRVLMLLSPLPPGQPWPRVQVLQEELLQVSRSTLMKSCAEPSPRQRPRLRRKPKPRPAPEPSTRQIRKAVALFRRGWLVAAGTLLVSLCASPKTQRARTAQMLPWAPSAQRAGTLAWSVDRRTASSTARRSSQSDYAPEAQGPYPHKNHPHCVSI